MIMKSLTKLLPCNLAQGLAGVSDQAIIKQDKVNENGIITLKKFEPRAISKYFPCDTGFKPQHFRKIQSSAFINQKFNISFSKPILKN